MKKIIFTLLMSLSFLPAYSEQNKKFNVLDPKTLNQKLITGTKSLREAILVHKKTKDSIIKVEEEYFSWLTQCIDLLEKSTLNSEWKTCLEFSSQLFQVETSGESSYQLYVLFEEKKAKFNEVIKLLSKNDQNFLTAEIKAHQKKLKK